MITFGLTKRIEIGADGPLILISRHPSAVLGNAFVHVAFEFKPEAIPVRTILAIDRGWARIGTASVIDCDGRVIVKGAHLEGTAFHGELKRFEEKSRRFSAKAKERLESSAYVGAGPISPSANTQTGLLILQSRLRDVRCNGLQPVGGIETD